jgi:hypothetical protein
MCFSVVPSGGRVQRAVDVGVGCGVGVPLSGSLTLDLALEWITSVGQCFDVDKMVHFQLKYFCLIAQKLIKYVHLVTKF